MIWFTRVTAAISLLLLIHCNVMASSTEEKRPNHIVFASPDKQGSPMFQWMSLVYGKLFSTMGYTFELVAMPSSRVDREVEQGNVTGQARRVINFDPYLQNQLQIEEPLYTLKVLALTNANLIKPLPKICSWQSLPANSHHVEYVHGYRTAAKKLKHLIAPNKLSVARTLKQGLNRLKHGRTDLLIIPYLDVRPYLHSPEFKGEIIATGIVTELDVYPFINSRYHHLGPQISNQLKLLKADNTIDQYLRHIFGQPIDIDKIRCH